MNYKQAVQMCQILRESRGIDCRVMPAFQSHMIAVIVKGFPTHFDIEGLSTFDAYFRITVDSFRAGDEWERHISGRLCRYPAYVWK